MRFDRLEQGWHILKNKDDLRASYPEPLYGSYRPQPYDKPEKYPCLYKEIAIIDNPNGADHAILAYIYDFEDDD